MVSPSAVKGTMVHAYQDLIDLGVCTDIKSFTASLIVEKDTQVIGRLNIQASGTLTWGLNQIALNLSLSK
jgi:phage tail sheath gpL-like